MGVDTAPTLLGDLEVLVAAQHHGLEHLVGGHMGLEVPWIPKFAHELAKALHQEEHDVSWRSADCSVVLFLQEVVSQGGNVGKSLENIENNGGGLVRKPIAPHEAAGGHCVTSPLHQLSSPGRFYCGASPVRQSHGRQVPAVTTRTMCV